ncbi:MAG: hypothetical protein CMQ02_09710 [Gammaproteobacteria bacterium]|nr:hypothetical protein [Gammaproteobacteria bacterium]
MSSKANKKTKQFELKDASKLMEDSFKLDKHLKPKASDLGDEELGDGVFQKKVRVHRDASGEVTQLIDADSPLTKEEELAQMKVYSKVAEQPPVIRNTPKTDKGKVIHILATRLFEDYVKNASNMTRPNPLRDGIPGCACPVKSKIGCVDWCGKDKLGPRIWTASAQEVYDWIVEVVKRRANIVDSSKKNG